MIRNIRFIIMKNQPTRGIVIRKPACAVPFVNQIELEDLIYYAWSEVVPSPGRGSLAIPSKAQIQLASALILKLCGINPLQCSDSMNRRIRLTVFGAIRREEIYLNRLMSPKFYRVKGIRKGKQGPAWISIECDERDPFTLHYYRQIAGITALIFHEKVNDLARGKVAVYFITPRAEQCPVAHCDRTILPWLLGGELERLKPGVTESIERPRAWCAALNFPLLHLRLLFGRFFNSSGAPLV